MAEKFAGLDLNSKRLGKRLVRTMETLAKNPAQSIWGASKNRGEAKAIYRMLGTKGFSSEEVLKEHRAATVKRMEGHAVILAVEDTMSLNYNTHEKTDGIGYISDKTLGVNIHSCIAVTPEGVVLGVLGQMHYNREKAKDDSQSHDKKKLRPLEEKESTRWPETLDEVSPLHPEGTKLVHVCDREGDMYELFNEAVKTDEKFLIRVVHNRKTTNNEYIIDSIQEKTSAGTITVVVPRDSRRNIKRRETVLDIRFSQYNIKRPARLNKTEGVLDSVSANIIYVKERTPVKDTEPIEWYLMTNEPVSNYEDAYEKVEYYIQRWTRREQCGASGTLAQA
jgi:hypothetical protein